MKQGCGILKIQSLTQATGRPFPFRLLNAGWGIAHEPDCLFERADYGYCTIEYVARGRGVLESDGRRFECGPGDVYFLHRHSNHRYWTDPAELWHKLFCMVDGELVDLLMDSYRLAGVYRIAEAPRLRQHFEALAALGGDGAVRDMRAAAIFHQLLEACAETLYERTLPARPGGGRAEAGTGRLYGRRLSAGGVCRAERLFGGASDPAFPRGVRLPALRISDAAAGGNGAAAADLHAQVGQGDRGGARLFGPVLFFGLLQGPDGRFPDRLPFWKIAVQYANPRKPLIRCSVIRLPLWAERACASPERLSTRRSSPSMVIPA